MAQATFDQYLRLGAMLKDGSLDREKVQAIIEGRISFTTEEKYRAHVVYVQPSYTELEQAFDLGYITHENAVFKSSDVCKDVSMEAREIKFELVHLDKDVSTDTALAELEKRKLRPALYEEILAFVAKYPELQKQFPIVALGSLCLSDDNLCFPYVGLRFLRFKRLDDGWGAVVRFLAVHK